MVPEKICRKHVAQVKTRYRKDTIFSELRYYEVTRGMKAIGATTQLAQFEQFCKSHRILPFSHEAAVMAADIWSDLKRRGMLINLAGKVIRRPLRDGAYHSALSPIDV